MAFFPHGLLDWIPDAWCINAAERQWIAPLRDFNGMSGLYTLYSELSDLRNAFLIRKLLQIEALQRHSCCPSYMHFMYSFFMNLMLLCQIKLQFSNWKLAFHLWHSNVVLCNFFMTECTNLTVVRLKFGFVVYCLVVYNFVIKQFVWWPRFILS